VLEQIPDDPQARLALRRAFYQKYGFGSNGGYGASELKFLEWEVARGVLNPLTGPKPGSKWWRSVNADLIADAMTAAKMFEEHTDQSAQGAVWCWLEYLRAPSPRTWYRAHNSSIASAYVAHVELARQETRAEQIFVNIVLYRVLYAQAMVEGAAAGIVGDLSRALPDGMRFQEDAADPRSKSVDLVVHLPDFYPRDYPVSRAQITQILGLARLHDFSLNVLFDDQIVSHGLGGLYALASDWLGYPALRQLVTGDTPLYPNQSRVYGT